MDLENWRPPTEHALVNTFAIRCFRDSGDGDYLMARMAMRGRLSANFLVSSQQAIEKYLKCILMLNRVPAKDLSHDLRKSKARISECLPFEILLRKPEQDFFDHLADWGLDRYLISSHHVFERNLLQLDMLVWHLRQYCQPLDVEHYADAPSREILMKKVAAIQAGLAGPPQAGHLRSGVLETILADPLHPVRESLVWRNVRYSVRFRKRLKTTNNFYAVNAPLFNNPELAGEVAKYMKIRSEVVEGARLLAKERQVDCVEELKRREGKSR